MSQRTANTFRVEFMRDRKGKLMHGRPAEAGERAKATKFTRAAAGGRKLSAESLRDGRSSKCKQRGAPCDQRFAGGANGAELSHRVLSAGKRGRRRETRAGSSPAPKVFSSV